MAGQVPTAPVAIGEEMLVLWHGMNARAPGRSAFVERKATPTPGILGAPSS
jgi:hypothetical protein